LNSQKTQKPILHAKEWLAITGKPLGASAGAKIFNQGGNAIDASCAMLAATATMWDVLSWGGETQALIYNPNTKEVIGINALGVAPTGATPEFFKNKGMDYPPRFGPLAAVTPGTPGGLMTMLAEYGTMSLSEVLAPAIDMAKGYPIEAQAANGIENNKDSIATWKYSKPIYLPHWESTNGERGAPYPGEIFVQQDLHDMLAKLVEAEKKALDSGKTRKEAIYAAYDRFYRGDIAEELVRGTQEVGGLITMEDLDKWQVYIEKPDMVDYKGHQIYKLTSWVQSPVLLQALNMAEEIDLKSMGYNSTNYLHALYQIMNLAFADRDFYYGDPYYEPKEPMKGLLSKEYAKQRLKEINWDKNDEGASPGDPYPAQEEENPYTDILEKWGKDVSALPFKRNEGNLDFPYEDEFYTGTTSIQAADKDGWVVSITPSGGWIPAVIAGRTGVGLSQRMQSFVLDKEENPFNVVEPGKRPRATLTPTIVMKDGKPFISVAVQGGDGQDQNTLQFLLNMIEFGMNVQQACEAPNMNSFQMHGSFGKHEKKPGLMLLNEEVPDWTRLELKDKGYKLQFGKRTSGPLNAVFFDWKHGSFWGGSSNHGEDYGIGW
jgi:gamma-glutamyltranspeptidase/glutathione hydrolase